MHSIRIGQLLRDFLGLAALAATFALALPGLQIARADDDPDRAGRAMSVDPLLVADAAGFELELPTVEPGPTCNDPGQAWHVDDAFAEYQTQQMLRTLVERVARQRPERGTEAQGMVLNGQGYNYPRRSARNDP